MSCDLSDCRLGSRMTGVFLSGNESSYGNQGLMFLRDSCCRIASVLSLSLALAGCSSTTNIFGDEDTKAIEIELELISLSMPKGANENWPARIELVRSPLGSGQSEELLRIDTRRWFEKERVVFQAAHPQLVFDYWEVVPGTAIGPFEMEVEEEVEGVLFCGVRSYPSPLRVDKGGTLNLKVDDSGCTIEQLEEPSGSWWNPLTWF